MLAALGVEFYYYMTQTELFLQKQTTSTGTLSKIWFLGEGINPINIDSVSIINVYHVNNTSNNSCGFDALRYHANDAGFKITMELMKNITGKEKLFEAGDLIKVAKTIGFNLIIYSGMEVLAYRNKMTTDMFATVQFITGATVEESHWQPI